MATTCLIPTTDDECFDDSKEMHVVDEVTWNKLLTARMKDGFADGKYMGEESTVQSGFDQGYAEGFELTFPFSIIQGLMAVNKIRLGEKNPSLLNHSLKIKASLIEFEKKISKFKLGRLQTVDNATVPDDEFLNKNDENYNSSSDLLEVSKVCNCSDTELNNEDYLGNDAICNIIKEYDALKLDIVNFLRECNQPLILKKIEDVFERWNLKCVIEHSLCKSRCSNCSGSCSSRKTS